ncbi:MAG: glycosyltransferase family 1 protein [Chloroflexi bacterium]|nr:glycosyltransferase family 1 protein [Chloroflexota bacterium]MCY4247951.1 glycosyltransferase family 1 protein [Chloroflexota bacterium]
MAHIGIDARLTHYRVGGISRYITALIAACETHSPPHKLTILQSRKAQRPLSSCFASAKLWTPPHHPLERSALSLELGRHRFDLLHSPDFIAPRRGARRHIITVHDLSFIRFPEYLTAESRQYYNGQIEASVARADHILANSQTTKDDLIAILDVPADKITVHLLAADERFRPLSTAQTADILRALDLPEQYLLFVGTLEPRKNLAGLAKAYRDLKLDLPDAPKLVVAGRLGWHYEQVLADVSALGIDEHILLRHAVSDEQLPAVYSRACAIILPSFHEGFGLTALEAMACGAVPIVSRVGALQEIVGGVGALVDPYNPHTIAAAMKRTLTDSDWLANQAQQALQRAAQFNWREAARIALNCYDALVG